MFSKSGLAIHPMLPMGRRWLTTFLGCVTSLGQFEAAATETVRCTAPDGSISYNYSCPTGHKATGLGGRPIKEPPAKKAAKGEANIGWHYAPKRKQQIIQPFSYKVEGHVTDAVGQVDASCYWSGKITGVGKVCGDSHVDLTRVDLHYNIGHAFVCKDLTACLVGRSCVKPEGEDYPQVRMNYIGPHMKQTPDNIAVERKINQAVKECQAWTRPTAESFKPESYLPPKANTSK